MADWMASWPRSVKRSRRMVFPEASKLTCKQTRRERRNARPGDKLAERLSAADPSKQGAARGPRFYRVGRPPKSAPASLSARRLLRLALAGGRSFALRLDGPRRAALGALAADLDASGLDLRALQEHDAEHAVLVLGGRPFGRDGLRQRERARESPVGALDAVVVVRLVALLEAALAAQRQHVILDRQLEVLPVHAGQLGFEHDLVLVLVDVHARHPSAAGDALVAEGARDVAGEKAIHLILQSPQVAER